MCLGLSSFRQKAILSVPGFALIFFILCSGPLQWPTLEPGNLFGVCEEFVSLRQGLLSVNGLTGAWSNEVRAIQAITVTNPENLTLRLIDRIILHLPVDCALISAPLFTGCINLRAKVYVPYFWESEG